MGQLQGVHEAFGLRVSIEFDVLVPVEDVSSRRVDLSAVMVTADRVLAAFGGSSRPARVHRGDAGGDPYTTERGITGDHLFRFGDRATFHLDADAQLLRVATADRSDPAWQRFLFDTVFGTCALVRGFEALHAAAFGGSHGLVAVVAPTGGGKTTFLRQMLLRGRTFVADDILALSRRAGDIVGHAGPPVMNLPADDDRSGTTLANFHDGRWVAVDRLPVRPSALRSVVLLERTRPGPPSTERLAASVLPLVGHALDTGPERRRHRFKLLADLAEQARLIRLMCPPSMPPREVTDLVEHELASSAVDV